MHTVTLTSTFSPEGAPAVRAVCECGWAELAYAGLDATLRATKHIEAKHTYGEIVSTARRTEVGFTDPPQSWTVNLTDDTVTNGVRSVKMACGCGWVEKAYVIQGEAMRRATRHIRTAHPRSLGLIKYKDVTRKINDER